MKTLTNQVADLVDSVFADSAPGKSPMARSGRWNGSASAVAASLSPTLALPLSVLDLLRSRLAETTEEASSRPPERPAEAKEAGNESAPTEEEEPEGQASGRAGPARSTENVTGSPTSAVWLMGSERMVGGR